ncbi:Lrp/AsnC family transcriptional regulator [Nocardioides antri]|uniref:Lrp/AsnC family transcriptional regulator n=1 Tax=Nocardioides antri TaxID=2607659 RepID=A0A5B1M264_9ACTN|nr:Lrp/AsnC family transcriptional regulator [Nocardioides antri]KAA1426706.1 Lrp/AsnC family transcriptional regulator [Nocardioides antri]
MHLDRLDLALLTALREHPRAGVLELSRLTKVARATVQARIQRLESTGVVTGYGPDIDLEAAGQHVSAFVTLEIAQGALDQLAPELEAMPTILEAYVTTGTADVLCKVAATSHGDLQETLIELNRSPSVVRTTSVVVLGTVVAPRVLPLLERSAEERDARAPAYRSRRDA